MTESFAQLFEQSLASQRIRPGQILSGLIVEVGDDMVIMADLCVDEYTSHGHCGIVGPDGDVDNDATLAIYCKASLAQAEAGAHVVAPSGMMDGQVGAIRHALDTAGFNNVAIMAYSAKYASGLYGPFRDAVDVQIAGGGNRKGYQQDWRNARESMPEGGVAKLEATRYESGVRILVHDEGAGIGEEEREHVFDLFYTTKERGTGLGLPLVRRAVENNGGEITARSSRGSGTKFELIFPVTPGAQQSREEAAEPHSA